MISALYGAITVDKEKHNNSAKESGPTSKRAKSRAWCRGDSKKVLAERWES